jgi:hypothetical protein
MTRELTGNTLIKATKAEVWAVIADLETVQTYNPFIQRARILTEARAGIGVTRQCDLVDGTFVRERVTAWHEGDGYSILITEENFAVDFPLAVQAVELSLSERDGGTAVEMTYAYDLKPGAAPSADEADALAAEIVSGGLQSLQTFVETGEPAKMPEMAPTPE